MKKFLTLIVLSLSLLTITAHAQRPWKTKKVFTGSDNKTWFSDGFQMLQHPGYQLDSTTTTDASYHAVDTVYIGDNEAGVLKVTTVGYYNTDGSAVTGVKVVRYNKVSGTLTLGTATDVLATEVDTTLSGSTWDISTSGNKIIVRVKGIVSTSIRWTSTSEKIAKYKI